MDLFFAVFCGSLIIATIILIVQGIEDIDVSLWYIGGAFAVIGAISMVFWVFTPTQYEHKNDRHTKIE